MPKSLIKVKETLSYICKHRLFYLLLGLIVSVRFILKIGAGYLDSDSWFILAEGRSILTNGIPYTNIYTVVDGLKTVVQQWLWDVIIYGIYSFAGSVGLFLFVCCTVALTAYLLYWLAKNSNMDKCLSALLVIITMFMLSDYFTTRPNLITFDILLIGLIFLEKYKKTGNWKCLISLPVLSFITINLHASMWLMVFLFALPYVFPAFKIFIADFSKREYKVRPILYAFIPSAAVLFLNPYGLSGIMYLFNSYGNRLTNIGIAELQNVAITSEFGGLILVALGFYTAVYIGQKKKITPEKGYLFFGTMILGCMYYKNTGYAMIGIFILMTDFLQDTDFKKFHDFANRQIKPVILLCFAALGYAVFDGVTEIYPVSDSVSTPLAAVEYLDENTDSGTAVYTSFNQGAYLEWSGYTIYVDARPELYFKKVNGKENVIDEYMVLETELTLEDYEAFKEKYGFQYYLAVDSSQIDAYLETDAEFEAVVDGEGYTLYAQKGV